MVFISISTLETPVGGAVTTTPTSLTSAGLVPTTTTTTTNSAAVPSTERQRWQWQLLW